MSNYDISIFNNTLPDELKQAIRYHFSKSVHKTNTPATDEDFRNYFGYFYDIDSYWHTTYVFLLRRDRDKKRDEIEYNHKIKIIIDGVLELGDEYEVETITPHLFKVSTQDTRLYCFGLTPNGKLFFSANETYNDIQYLPNYEELLKQIYFFHEKHCVN